MSGNGFTLLKPRGTNLFGDLLPPQQAKIKCGEGHFAALADTGIRFKAPVASYSRFDDFVNEQMEK